MTTDVKTPSDPSPEETREELPGSGPDDPTIERDETKEQILDRIVNNDPDEEQILVGSRDVVDNSSTAKPDEGETPEPEKEGDVDDKPKGEVDDPEPKPAEKETAEPDLSYPDDKEIKGNTPNAQKRIQQLVAARRHGEAKVKDLEARVAELTTKAKYREEHEKFLAENKIPAKTWDQWIELGRITQTDPVKAAEIFASMAKSLAAAVPAPDPATVKLDEDLASYVEDMGMTEEVAKSLQIKRNQASARPAPPPSLAPEARLHVDEEEAAKAKLSAFVAKFDQENRTKYGTNWPKIAEEINKELAHYKGTPIHLWERTVRDVTEKVIAKRMPRTPTPDPVARSTSSRGAGDPETLTPAAILERTLFRKG